MISLIFGIPIEFLLFGATLLGVAFFHRHTLAVAALGLAAILLYKLAVTGFHEGPGIGGFWLHLGHEWVTLGNLFGLLLGFALLSLHFDESRVPLILPRRLPQGWMGGLALLAFVFVLSAFLDNIAAVLIGGTLARSVFRNRVHIGYLAALVAAANAGGAGSVLGDTTTTMIWISGVSPVEVLHAYVAAAIAFLICALPAAYVQHRHAPIQRDMPANVEIDWTRLLIVALVLIAALATNLIVNARFPALADRFPFLGAAVWAVLLITVPLRRPDWRQLRAPLLGSLFLLSLVLSASLMPVETLPQPGWTSTLALGFISAVFDNIPLTALAIRQGGYDWGVLAYAVGFGGSMIWFGSSAGVAISNLFPEAKSVGAWLRHGWYVIPAYVGGFAALMLTLGWNPGR